MDTNYYISNYFSSTPLDEVKEKEGISAIAEKRQQARAEARVAEYAAAFGDSEHSGFAKFLQFLAGTAETEFSARASRGGTALSVQIGIRFSDEWVGLHSVLHGCPVEDSIQLAFDLAEQFCEDVLTSKALKDELDSVLPRLWGAVSADHNLPREVYLEVSKQPLAGRVSEIRVEVAGQAFLAKRDGDGRVQLRLLGKVD